MRRIKARRLLAVMLLSAALAGCGAQDKPVNQPGSAVQTPATTSTPSPSSSPEPTPEIFKRDAIIYFSDNELNEIVEKPVTLSYETEAELVEAAVLALQEDGFDEAMSLWKPIEIKSIELEADLVRLNVHLPDEARLGAPGELMLIKTLQQTLFQFDFVNKIELLVDGEAIESMMGHVELEHPFTRE
ncbi:GerMN domain-containing protein [Paenibacillus sp. sgz302251]|uniref:GerMN domain-containing protein n=1 Tax=Paenibacillus sp. sgz302251 TaxID=3414493 RepID=UPI003C7BDA3A